MAWPERLDPKKRDSTRWGWAIFDGPYWIKREGGWAATREEAVALAGLA